MTGRREQQALILEPGSPGLDSEIGRIVATGLGVLPADGVARVRYGGGILINSSSPDKIAEIAARLRKIDVEARIVPAEMLSAAARGYRVMRLEFLDGTISAGMTGGRELVVLESDLRGIQIHAQSSGTGLCEEGGRDSFRVPLASAFREGHVSQRGLKILEWIEESERPAPRFVLTLYARDPVGPLRFESDSTDYSMLGEEKLGHSMDNFLLLAETLVTRYPDLHNRERVLRFLDSLDPAQILLFKPEESSNFDRWIQAWIRLDDMSEFSDVGPGNKAHGPDGQAEEPTT